MSGHTPGPWREGIEGNNRVYGPDGRGDDSGLIAVVYKGRGNIRLIAAAPDLLEALETMLRRCDWYGSAIYPDEYGDDPVTGEELRDMAKAAIDKAKGVTP